MQKVIISHLKLSYARSSRYIIYGSFTKKKICQVVLLVQLNLVNEALGGSSMKIAISVGKLILSLEAQLPISKIANYMHSIEMNLLTAIIQHLLPMKNKKYGYVFENCRLTGNCPDKTVMLSRPWRIYAKAVFIQCEMSSQITDEGFHDWNKKESHDTCYYAEYKCFGAGYKPHLRPDYIHQLTDSEALEYTKENVLKW